MCRATLVGGKHSSGQAMARKPSKAQTEKTGQKARVS
jgi:hypothetical protein